MSQRNNIVSTLKRAINTPLGSVIVNIFWVYLFYEICRLIFLWENWSMMSDKITWDTFKAVLRGGWRFDSSAIFYTNSLYILLALLPLHIKEGKRIYNSIVKWIYVVVNSFCIFINLADTVFFGFREHRTSMRIFQEFGNDNNVGSIVWGELISHWYLVVALIIMVYAFIRLYHTPSAKVSQPLWRYYLKSTLIFAMATLVSVCAMRGNIFFLSSTRPISINYAFRYTTDPVMTGLVLNTPFSLIRTVGQVTIAEPKYFKTQEELDAIYTPVHTPKANATMKQKNVVILIVESFAQEFIGALNKNLDGGTYAGYTPYTDAMLDSCMYFEQMFDNTGFSIDAPPAVFASIPRADTPFVTSPHSVNNINSIASELKNAGYTSAFFHGADNESLGFHAFTRQAGFDLYFGQDEFYADSRFGGRAEFDGKWGIWDEPFLQFFCAKISEMKQPFLASVFTLTSHHPFKIPQKYADRFKDEGAFEIHKCIKYTDYSIHQFFEEARKQPWFDNTIFVLCADHGSSKRTHDVYKNQFGSCRIPILFYDPSGELPRGQQPGIAQQIDIMPTLLDYLGYDKPYIAFGKSLLSTPPKDTWAFNWNHMPFYVKGDYVMFFDTENVSGLYNYKNDPLLKSDLKGTNLPIEQDMKLEVEALIQSYLSRMNDNNVTIKP